MKKSLSNQYSEISNKSIDFENYLNETLINIIKKYVTAEQKFARKMYYYVLPENTKIPSYKPFSFFYKGFEYLLYRIEFNSESLKPLCIFMKKSKKTIDDFHNLELYFSSLLIDTQLDIIKHVVESFEFLELSKITAYNYISKEYIEANSMTEISHMLNIDINDIFDKVLFFNITDDENIPNINDVAINGWLFCRHDSFYVYRNARDDDERWMPKSLFMDVIKKSLFPNDDYSLKNVIENHPLLFSKAQVFFKNYYIGTDDFVLIDFSARKNSKIKFLHCPSYDYNNDNKKYLEHIFGKTLRQIKNLAKKDSPYFITSPNNGKLYAIHQANIFSQELWDNIKSQYKSVFKKR